MLRKLQVRGASALAVAAPAPQSGQGKGGQAKQQPKGGGYQQFPPPCFPSTEAGSKKRFRIFLRIHWTNRSNGGLSGGRNAVLSPDRERGLVQATRYNKEARPDVLCQRELLERCFVSSLNSNKLYLYLKTLFSISFKTHSCVLHRQMMAGAITTTITPLVSNSLRVHLITRYRTKKRKPPFCCSLFLTIQ